MPHGYICRGHSDHSLVMRVFSGDEATEHLPAHFSFPLLTCQQRTRNSTSIKWEFYALQLHLDYKARRGGGLQINLSYLGTFHTCRSIVHTVAFIFHLHRENRYRGCSQTRILVLSNTTLQPLSHHVTTGLMATWQPSKGNLMKA